MNFIIKIYNLLLIPTRRLSNLRQPCKIKKLQYSKVPTMEVILRVAKSQKSNRIKSLMSKRIVGDQQFKSWMIVHSLRKKCFNRLSIKLSKVPLHKTTLKIQLTQMVVVSRQQIQWCTKLACKRRSLLLQGEVIWLMRNCTKCSEREWSWWRRASQSRFNSSSSNLLKN